MTEHGPLNLQREIDAMYRNDSRRVLATLIRLLGDFDLAEEALHDAFVTALDVWSKEGIPENPRAWLISTGRFKAIDRLRRRTRFDAALATVADRLEIESSDAGPDQHGDVDDDRLRLIFTCCHPALTADARIALTLREVCGLETEQIAHAFLVPAPTLAQRIVRAKAKIRDAGIPYQVPSREDLPERLDAVLHVIYLVFNEGYSASSGESVIRSKLCDEAIRLSRLLMELLPEAESTGLLALMLLHDARKEARTSSDGELVLLEDQDRTLWNRAQIAEGLSLVEQALRSGRFGFYTLQAAVAAVHAEAPTAAETDWHQILGLYDVLMRTAASPIIELNRAVAVAMVYGPEAGLAIVNHLIERSDLPDYHLAYSAQADLYRRLNKRSDAIAAYERALQLTTQQPERRFLLRRLAELKGRSQDRT
jgi:RNA polymerase sigma-70 factor, ECF subfamily